MKLEFFDVESLKVLYDRNWVVPSGNRITCHRITCLGCGRKFVKNYNSRIFCERYINDYCRKSYMDYCKALKNGEVEHVIIGEDINYFIYEKDKNDFELLMLRKGINRVLKRLLYKKKEIRVKRLI